MLDLYVRCLVSHNIPKYFAFLILVRIKSLTFLARIFINSFSLPCKRYKTLCGLVTTLSRLLAITGSYFDRSFRNERKFPGLSEVIKFSSLPRNARFCVARNLITSMIRFSIAHHISRSLSLCFARASSILQPCFILCSNSFHFINASLWNELPPCT